MLLAVQEAPTTQPATANDAGVAAPGTGVLSLELPDARAGVLNDPRQLPELPLTTNGGLTALIESTATPPAEGPATPGSYDAVLAPYVLVFCAAFALSYVFTPIMRQVAVSYDVVDRPDGEEGRKLHRRPTAYLGGIAVFLGLVGGLVAGQFFSELHHPAVDGMLRIPMPIIGGACIITLLGLADDLLGIPPKLKILGQAVAAACLLGFGVGDHVLRETVSFGFAWLHENVGIEFPQVIEQAVVIGASWAFVIGLVVFCCNASNLMDGLDGLCGGVTAIIAAGLVFVAASLALGGEAARAPQDAVRVALSLALLGAVLGFLPFNFNPASIFMGDAGSLLMGFVVATMIVLLGTVSSKWMMGALVMFSLPVLDTALAFARRWVKGRPLFSADRHHFHHQLIARGLTVRRAVVLSYGLSVFFVVAGSLMIFLRTRYVVAIYLVLFGSIIVAAYKMGMVHERIGPRDGELPDDEDLSEDNAVEATSAASAPASEDEATTSTAPPARTAAA